jgi:N-succinyl-L-ornithine transcarbamylase
MESATVHPLQSLTDLNTIKENKEAKNPKILLTWAPHPKVLPQAVANSFAQWTLAAGYDLTIACPKGYELSTDFCQRSKGSSQT